MKKFFDWLFSLFGYVPKADLEKSQEFASSEHLRCVKFENENIDLHYELEKARQTIDQFKNEPIEEIKAESKRLKLELDEISADHVKMEEFYRTVQKQLSGEFHHDPVFGFTSSPAIPGASVVTGFYNGNDNSSNIVGRTLLMDNITAKVNNAMTMAEKYRIILNTMIQLGLIDKIAQNLIATGAIQLSLTYNENCTTSEVYYMVKCQKPDPDSILTINLKKEEEG